jgi:hypothetical protein
MWGLVQASGIEIEVEGELAVATVLCPNALQGLAGSLAHTVGLQPALHPNVATFGLPDLGELHHAATLGTFEEVVAEGSHPKDRTRTPPHLSLLLRRYFQSNREEDINGHDSRY